MFGNFSKMFGAGFGGLLASFIAPNLGGMLTTILGPTGSMTVNALVTMLLPAITAYLFPKNQPKV